MVQGTVLSSEVPSHCYLKTVKYTEYFFTVYCILQCEAVFREQVGIQNEFCFNITLFKPVPIYQTVYVYKV